MTQNPMKMFRFRCLSPKRSQECEQYKNIGYIGRPITLYEAEKHAREQGWSKVKGKWTCPKCKEV